MANRDGCNTVAALRTNNSSSFAKLAKAYGMSLGAEQHRPAVALLNSRCQKSKIQLRGVKTTDLISNFTSCDIDLLVLVLAIDREFFYTFLTGS